MGGGGACDNDNGKTDASWCWESDNDREKTLLHKEDKEAWSFRYFFQVSLLPKQTSPLSNGHLFLLLAMITRKHAGNLRKT